MTLSDIIHSLNVYQVKLIPPQAFWLIVVIISLFVLYYMRQSYQHLKRARILEDIPTAKIRSAAQGYVALKGTQHPFANHHSFTRLSHTPCTWHRYIIEFYDRNNGWTLLEQGSSASLFLLQDEGDQCVIDPENAEIATPVIDCWQGFSRYPKKKPGSWFGRLWGMIGNYRYTEWTMHDSMPLAAMGNFHTYSSEDFAKRYPDYQSSLKPNEAIHLLSKEGLDKQNPFVLSAYEEQVTIRKHRIESFFWFLAYITILAGLAVVVTARLH